MNPYRIPAKPDYETEVPQLSWYRQLLCRIGKHSYSIFYVIRRNNEGLIGLVRCGCGARWVYSDPHKAFIRYDKGYWCTFKRDLERIYNLPPRILEL